MPAGLAEFVDIAKLRVLVQLAVRLQAELHVRSVEARWSVGQGNMEVSMGVVDIRIARALDANVSFSNKKNPRKIDQNGKRGSLILDGRFFSRSKK